MIDLKERVRVHNFRKCVYVHLRFHRMRSTALSCQPKDTTARLLLTLPLIINEVAMYSKAKYQRPYYKNKRH